MTDLNKPVKIKHDAETGDILNIENDCAVDDYWFEQRYADAKFAEAQKAERSRQWREEATIHAYPYSKTEPMTIDEVKKESGAGVVINGEPANYGDYYKPTAPKPSQVHFKPSPEKIKEMAEAFKPMQENFKKIGKSAKKATESFKKFPATGSHENRGTNLQHRPFHNLEMIVFRDSLEENQ